MLAYFPLLRTDACTRDMHDLKQSRRGWSVRRLKDLMYICSCTIDLFVQWLFIFLLLRYPLRNVERTSSRHRKGKECGSPDHCRCGSRWMLVMMCRS
uniref:Predicted protein n=1 Tax=Hordeum vulgare subsp. vulgare TaxID=112509 RepID=F2CQT5_HORVV|nr:predicted protein [Hordeum vulgare subsp. vulgare]